MVFNPQSPDSKQQLDGILSCVCAAHSWRRTCTGLSDPWVGLLGTQVLPDHFLQRAHEDGDEAVDVAGVVAAGRLQDHQSSWESNQEGERWMRRWSTHFQDHFTGNCR